MENNKSLVSLLAESLLGVIVNGKPINRKHIKRFYSITGQLAGFMNRQYGCVDKMVKLERYVGQRAMLNGMKDDEFVDAVCKAKDLQRWENLMFYNYV
ncbi:MAG: hypothetical protein Q7R87_02390 [Nanoarchaeota archaeon]|nr:hypothetical protein [Nanoarchaeota archaeon]